MPIPRGTRQAMGLRDVAERLSVARATAKRWWLDGRLVGRTSSGRVVIPVEVVDFYLRYFRLPTKRELFDAEVLSREFLLELNGPDGGLSELADDESSSGVMSDSGTYPVAS